MEQKQQKPRILIIAANPLDTKNISVNEEYREIEKILEVSKYWVVPTNQCSS